LLEPGLIELCRICGRLDIAGALSITDVPGGIASVIAEPVEEKAGDGDPVHTMRGVYPNSGLAKAAAEAKLERLTRGTQTLNITLAGRPELVAESKIYLSGFRPGIPIDWVITRAEHTLDSSGYTTTIEASRDFKGETDDQ